MCWPFKEEWSAEGASRGQDLSPQLQRTTSGLRMGFAACLLCNKFSKKIRLELSKHPVLNSNNIIQKLKQGANLSEHACFTKTKKILVGTRRRHVPMQHFNFNETVFFPKEKLFQRIHFNQLYRYPVKASLKWYWGRDFTGRNNAT